MLECILREAVDELDIAFSLAYNFTRAELHLICLLENCISFSLKFFTFVLTQLSLLSLPQRKYSVGTHTHTPEK